MVELAWLIPVLPLAAALFIALFGHRTTGQGDRVGIGAISVAFLLSAGVLFDVMQGGRAARSFTWAIHGGLELNLGYQVDQLTALMLFVVTLVSLMVHIYSVGYMEGDRRYKRYYGVLSLFTFSMLGLVLADNLLFMYVFWELMGLCSYLLIGHYFEERANVHAANKAFLTTRVGDVGMFIGIMLAFAAGGSFRFDELSAAAASGTISMPVLTLIALLIFIGPVGKSAQFPLHVWLPDAMAGPTPASALIHAATMVAAGVYLVARSYGIFAPAAEALQVVAWVGAFTALFAATMALVMEDIKKVLAYSTISQLGFMVAALGVGAYTAAIFHLMTHAFFKALLFLASGSVIHAVHTQNMHEMGGLFRKLPVTGWTWLIGAGALIGIPPLSGFWSKEEILLEASHVNPAVFWMLIAAAALTAFYTTRATYLTFFGEPRNREAYEHAHESGRVMTYPLIILGVLAAVSGFFAGPLAEFIHFGEPHHAEFDVFVFGTATGAWVLGLVFALGIFKYGILSRRKLISALYPIWVLLKRRYYIDDLYQSVFVRGMVGLALLSGWFDRHVIDFVVNAVAWMTRQVSRYVNEFDRGVVDGAVNGIGGAFVAGSRLFRRAQTGLVQSYVLVLFAGLVAGLAILVIGG
ncbi:MAG: NADH-quinone oxidoreductase subunit L [Firmicutes bacterium]|nr:NADH-quinone oxidoreductase subunit L [Bacillota bacterium]